jgi:hypothetical protein
MNGKVIFIDMNKIVDLYCGNGVSSGFNGVYAADCVVDQQKQIVKTTDDGKGIFTILVEDSIIHSSTSRTPKGYTRSLYQYFANGNIRVGDEFSLDANANVTGMQTYQGDSAFADNGTFDKGGNFTMNVASGGGWEWSNQTGKMLATGKYYFTVAINLDKNNNGTVFQQYGSYPSDGSAESWENIRHTFVNGVVTNFAIQTGCGDKVNAVQSYNRCGS